MQDVSGSRVSGLVFRISVSEPITPLFFFEGPRRLLLE